jgi:hypothetical protein
MVTPAIISFISFPPYLKQFQQVSLFSFNTRIWSILTIFTLPYHIHSPSLRLLVPTHWQDLFHICVLQFLRVYSLSKVVSLRYFAYEYIVLCPLELFCASMWTLGLIFISLWRKSLEFWWGLHWTPRLLLVIQDFQSSDYEDPWARKILIYSFCCRGLSLPLLKFIPTYFIF